MSTIDFVYFNAGGGHRAAASALQEVIARQGRPWRIRLVNLVDMIDPKGQFQRWLGCQPEDFYNFRLARGWTAGLTFELRLLQRAIGLGHGWMTDRIARHWQGRAPDLIVSLIPNFNRALHDAGLRAAPKAPFVTVMTDIADLPPRFWIEPGIAQHIVCGSEHAAHQARQAGLRPDRIWLTSGMVLRPAFYEQAAVDPAAERRALGLDPAQPTGVVLFGGHGSAQMLDIARELDDVQLVLMCGHNRRLAAGLQALRRRAPHAVVGFTAEVPRYLRLGDFFIGKPGPGSLSEAAHLGLPALTFDTAATMPQERYNLRWLRDEGLGRSVRHARELRGALRELLQGGDVRGAGQRAGRPDNRAVFEIPEILADVLTTAQARRAGARAPLAGPLSASLPSSARVGLGGLEASR